MKDLDAAVETLGPEDFQVAELFRAEDVCALTYLDEPILEVAIYSLNNELH